MLDQQPVNNDKVAALSESVDAWFFRDLRFDSPKYDRFGDVRVDFTAHEMDGVLRYDAETKKTQATYICYDEPPECFPNHEIPEYDADPDALDYLTRNAPDEFMTMVAGVRETVIALARRR